MRLPFPSHRDPEDQTGSAPASQPLNQTIELLVAMAREGQHDDPARALECLQQAAELARSIGDGHAEGQALLLRGSIQNRQGEFAGSESSLTRALDLGREIGDRLGIAARLNALAYLRFRQGRADEAMALLREALGCTTEAADEQAAFPVRAETLMLLGMAYANRGETGQALRYYEEALELRRAAEDTQGVARALNSIGNLRHRTGNYEEAVSCYRQALDLLRTLEERRDAAATANNLASTLMRLGEMDEARQLFEECRRRFADLGDRARVADVLLNLGLLAQAQGRMEEAEKHYRESLTCQQELGNPPGESNALINLSYLAVARGCCEEAIERADESLALLERSNLQSILALAFVPKGLAMLELDQLAGARDAAEDARRAAERADARDQLADALALRAYVFLTEGQLDEALAVAVESLRLAEETADPELLAVASRCLGAVRLARGELEEAQQILTQAARLLRGWEDSYERARVRFEEGLLLARAGGAEAGAERLRRAARTFAAIGNIRWRIQALLALAQVVETSDPVQAEANRTTARALAEDHQLTLLLDRSFLKQETAFGRAAPLAGAAGAAAGAKAASLIGISGALLEASANRQPEAAPYLDPFFAFLRRELGVTHACLRLESQAALRWGLQATSLDGQNFRALREDTSGKADGKLLLCFVCPTGLTAEEADRIGAEPDTRIRAGLGPGQAPFGRWAAERRGAAPFSDGEREAAESASRILALALEAQFERAERSALPVEMAVEGGRFEFLVGSSRSMKEIYRLIAQVAPTDSSVLVLGESGTGKELVARSIHARSQRREGPFVAISCPSIPRDLIESELFGHERGAFTGAVTARQGKIELAEGGTLFLDELGDMPLATQAKILRFLQEREFQRVGGRKNLRVNVRLLSATNRDIKAAMERGEFREDLYYRLNVVPLRMPSLRERREDVPLLVEHFLRLLPPGESGQPRRISSGALDRLLAYDWPGNVRELRNTIEYMTTVCEGDVLETGHLPASIMEKGASRGALRAEGGPSVGGSAAPGLAQIRPGETLESRLMDVEAALIRVALEAVAWNQSAAARRLGITESKIRNRMKQYGIRRPGKS